MPMLNFYVPDDVDPKVIRQQLNEIAASLGYTAKAGPGGSGGSAAMLIAIAQGGLKVMPRFTVQVPALGWDQDDQSALVEQRIDDETFLSVDIIDRPPVPGADDRYSVRHAAIIRSADNSEVRQVLPREIELVATE